MEQRRKNTTSSLPPPYQGKKPLPFQDNEAGGCSPMHITRNTSVAITDGLIS